MKLNSVRETFLLFPLVFVILLGLVSPVQAELGGQEYIKQVNESIGTNDMDRIRRLVQENPENTKKFIQVLEEAAPEEAEATAQNYRAIAAMLRDVQASLDKAGQQSKGVTRPPLPGQPAAELKDSQAAAIQKNVRDIKADLLRQAQGAVDKTGQQPSRNVADARSRLRQGIVPVAKPTQVVIKTNVGDIEVELNPEKAPNSVRNFLQYVNANFYDGTIFHRVIRGFMIQGGGFTKEMDQKRTQAPIAIESGNGLKNDRGTVAMARTNDPHSATSQFFINTRDNAFLNYSAPTAQGYGYTVFGKVIKGMEVVDQIESAKTGFQGPMGDVPVTPIIIEKISVK